MKSCPNCGKVLNDQSMFCDVCGTSLNNTITPNSPMYQQPPKKKGKGCLIVAIVAAVIIFFPMIIGIISKSGNESSTASTTAPTGDNVSQTAPAPGTPTPVPAELLIEPAEHGTTKYADYLFYKAVDDSRTATDEQLKEAVSFLKSNINSYFSSQENMEKTMYYGKLLQYRYRGSGNAYEEIGDYAYMTVKYVYRGIDKVTDRDTIRNLDKLQRMAASLPDLK